MFESIDSNLKWAIVTGLILFSAFLISTILRRLIHLYVNQFSSKIKADPTNFSFLKNSVSFVVYMSAAIFIFRTIPALRSLGTALFAGAGVIAAIIGFASQQAFSNIINGIFILMFRPFRVGDIIETSDNKKGIVEEITLRHTVIKDYDNRRLIIPNSTIGQEKILNSDITDANIRQRIKFGISYDSDIDTALKIIEEEALNHPLCIDNRTPEDIDNGVGKVMLRVVGWGESSVDILLYAWATSNDNGFTLQCDLYYTVKKRFDQVGIEIPYPHRSIVMKKA